MLLTSIGTDYAPSFAKKTGVGSSILSSSIITDISLLSNTPLANFRLNVFGVMPKALAIAVLEYDFSAINPASLSVLIILTPFSLVAFYVPSIAHIMVHVKYLFGLIPTFLLHIAQSVNGSGGHKNSARLQPCGTKEKEREMRNLFPPIIKQIDERGKRMAKQKDGRYRAKITVGTGAI